MPPLRRGIPRAWIQVDWYSSRYYYFPFVFSYTNEIQQRARLVPKKQNKSKFDTCTNLKQWEEEDEEEKEKRQQQQHGVITPREK